MRRLLLALLIGLSAVIVMPGTAYACSCAQQSVAQHAEEADLVVRGTIEDRDVLGLPVPVMSSGDEVVYDVSVDRVYQGRSGPRVEIHSVRSGASCGIEVEVGGEYVVFADRRDGQLEASLCGGTTPVTDLALEEVASVTGDGEPPDPTITLPDSDSGPPVLALAGGGVVLLVLAGGMLRFRRRRRPGPGDAG